MKRYKELHKDIELVLEISIEKLKVDYNNAVIEAGI